MQIMRWTLLLGLGLYLIFIVITWAGMPMGAPWFDAPLAALDVMMFQLDIVYPSLLLIGIGFGLGIYVPRIIGRLIPMHRRYEQDTEDRIEKKEAALNVFRLGVEEDRREEPKESA